VPKKIFLSYSSLDRDKAEAIALSLSRSYRVFFDRDNLPAGQSFDDRIEHAINESEFFIFLISPNSVGEGQGRFTVSELALARQKWPYPSGHVLPIMLEPTPLNQVPAYLKAVTILEPKGNIAVETRAAVAQMQGEPSFDIIRFLRQPRSLVGLVAICGLMGALAYFLLPSTDAEPKAPIGLTVWGVGDSEVYLEPSGNKRQFKFLRPGKDLWANGASKGSILFEGQRDNDQYKGSLFVFAPRCPAREYNAAGLITNGETTVTLTGRAPVIDPKSCAKVNEEERSLIFDFKHK
jgi:TIR domain-containing protein